jgi:hypothetical protein
MRIHVIGAALPPGHAKFILQTQTVTLTAGDDLCYGGYTRLRGAP